MTQQTIFHHATKYFSEYRERLAAMYGVDLSDVTLGGTQEFAQKFFERHAHFPKSVREVVLASICAESAAMFDADARELYLFDHLVHTELAGKQILVHELTHVVHDTLDPHAKVTEATPYLREGFAEYVTQSTFDYGEPLGDQVVNAYMDDGKNVSKILSSDLSLLETLGEARGDIERSIGYYFFQNVVQRYTEREILLNPPTLWEVLNPDLYTCD